MVPIQKPTHASEVHSHPQSSAGAPYTIPPQPFPPEVISELAENCHAPLFLPSELDEWADMFKAHAAFLITAHPSCDAQIFDGLTAHPITNPLLDGPLFCLQIGFRLCTVEHCLMFNGSTLLQVCGLLCVLILRRTPRT